MACRLRPPPTTRSGLDLPRLRSRPERSPPRERRVRRAPKSDSGSAGLDAKCPRLWQPKWYCAAVFPVDPIRARSEEHTSELQSRGHLVCRLLLEKKTAAQ